MKAIIQLPLYIMLYVWLSATSSVMAMSMSPDNEQISEDSGLNQAPETAARMALKKGDFRLLGIATRVTSIPGVPTHDRQLAIETCGVRLMEGLGDVIRSDDELATMQQAFDYAQKYNQLVIVACFKKP